MKQMIVMRADLNMGSKGKWVAQGAHASLAAVLRHQDDPRVQEWLAGDFKKVTVRVESSDELYKLVGEASAAGLIVGPPIIDAGHTVFKEPTLTCVAIGPDTDEKLNPITGHLRLL